MICVFPGCSFSAANGEEYCPRHRPKGMVREKKRHFLNAVSPKTKARQEQHKLENAEMDLFWLQAEKELDRTPYCMECAAFIPKETVQQPDGPPVAKINLYRAATAHIFPKSLFPSVAAHPMNKLFLGAGCCHDRSHELLSFSKMKVFKIAVERFRIFEPFIIETHKYLTEFKQYADKI